MKRREFIGLSAAAAASIMAGKYIISGNRFPNSSIPDESSRRMQPRMRGGCGDYRMMDNTPPDIFEREIFGHWA